MPAALSFDEKIRADHYLAKARQEDDCLCLGNGRYRPTWHKERGHRKERGGTERIAVLICRVFYGSAPDGKSQALHSCCNIHCINPKHLRWGSASENIKEAFDAGHNRPPIVDQGRRVREGRHLWARLTPSDIVAIRQRLANRERLMSIANDYSVSFKTISKIKLRQRWAHVP